MKNKQNKLARKKIEYVYGLYSSGQFQLAVDNIKTLNKKYPNEPLLFNLIGACYKELGQLPGAAKMFGVAVSLNPNYAEAHFNLGCIYQDLKQNENAIESYKNAVKINRSYADAYNNLGNILREIGDHEAAIESLEWAVTCKYDFAEAHNNLGKALYDFGKIEESIESFKVAISLKKNYPRALYNLSLSYYDIGNEILHLQMLKKALDLKPYWSEAHLTLSRIKKYKKNDPQISKIRDSVSSSQLNEKDLINFNFVLAKFYEDIKDYENQFKHLNEANKLRKIESGYFIDKDISLFSRIKDTFKETPNILDNKFIKSSDIRPIFILGMPRSGTSLVHQIISSHPLVYGAGELNKIYKFAMPFVQDKENTSLSEKNLLLFRTQYLEYLASLGSSEKVIVDKMPINFRFVGFIIAAFPDAKIIHMERDPMATCWSIYKYFFPGNHYSYDQDDIAMYYGLYENLMNFWSNKFPNKIYDFNYESLTSNQEEETRNILKYCDLDWDDNCLNFYNNITAMKTTSAMQVKKKMYKGSSDVWRIYKSYLQPLIKGLNYNKV
ncbi:sulfotransferase [Candidatus Pseudothioglobus singularis]|nr:sulfotransferase [Candidatus Pseudothioglobus singularis]